jgi:hypothetical protein
VRALRPGRRSRTRRAPPAHTEQVRTTTTAACSHPPATHPRLSTPAVVVLPLARRPSPAHRESPALRSTTRHLGTHGNRSRAGRQRRARRTPPSDNSTFHTEQVPTTTTAACSHPPRPAVPPSARLPALWALTSMRALSGGPCARRGGGGGDWSRGDAPCTRRVVIHPVSTFRTPCPHPPPPRPRAPDLAEISPYLSTPHPDPAWRPL